MLLLNTDMDFMEALGRMEDEECMSDAVSTALDALKGYGFKRVYRYDYEETGLLHRPVEVSIWTNDVIVVILKTGIDYEQSESELFEEIKYIEVHLLDDDRVRYYNEFKF